MNIRPIAFSMAIAALCVSLAAFAIVTIRKSRPPNDSLATNDMVPEEQIAAIRHRGETGPAIARIVKIGNTSDFHPADGAYLLQVLEDPFASVKESAQSVGTKAPAAIDEADTIILQRWALLTIADRLRQSQMDNEMRRSLENAIIGFLDNKQWRLRRRAILSLREAEIATRSDIQERIRRLATDPRAEVANTAMQVLGQ